MTFLPIVGRELGVAARKPATHWVRWAATGIAAGFSAVMLLLTFLGSPAGVGKTMMLALTWPLWTYCLLEGVRQAADCMSSEKREGTLGLLFLTDLRSYDVVLGKFVSAAIPPFYTLFAMLPVLALPILCGGVMPGEYWRVVLALMNTLFFSLTFSLCISTAVREERHAWGGAIGLVIGIGAALPIMAAMLPSRAAAVLRTFSPAAVCARAFDFPYHSAPGLFWGSFAITHGASWLMLLLAGFWLPHAWRDRHVMAKKPGLRFSSSIRNGTRTRPRTSLEADPAFFLVSGGKSAPLLLWSCSICPVLIAVVAALLGAELAAIGYFLWACVGFQLLIFALWASWEASYGLAELRRSGMFELLLTTPLDPHRVVWSFDKDLWRRFAGPGLSILLIEFFLCGAYGWESRGNARFPVGVFIGIALVLGMGIYVLLLGALTRVAMWLSLSTARAGTAWGRAVLYVLVLPFIVGMLPTIVCGPSGPVIWLGSGICLWIWADLKMRNDLRTCLARPYGAGRQLTTPSDARIHAPPIITQSPGIPAPPVIPEETHTPR